MKIEKIPILKNFLNKEYDEIIAELDTKNNIFLEKIPGVDPSSMCAIPFTDKIEVLPYDVDIDSEIIKNIIKSYDDLGATKINKVIRAEIYCIGASENIQFSYPISSKEDGIDLLLYSMDDEENEFIIYKENYINDLLEIGYFSIDEVKKMKKNEAITMKSNVFHSYSSSSKEKKYLIMYFKWEWKE